MEIGNLICNPFERLRERHSIAALLSFPTAGC
jgi:hypothetical protein